MLSSELTFSLFLCGIILAMTKITNSQTLIARFPNAYVNQRLWQNYDSWNRKTQEHNTMKPSTSDHVIGTGKILRNLNPPSRRFLFSPTIQNTITNLNQNSNLAQEAPLSESADRKSTFRHMNLEKDAVEYDVRSLRPKKICITFE